MIVRITGNEKALLSAPPENKARKTNNSCRQYSIHAAKLGAIILKATGIVRRIDDLGRVVIPKELRRTLGIKEGDPVEFFVDGELITIRKYSPGTARVDLATEEIKWLRNAIVGWKFLETDSQDEKELLSGLQSKLLTASERLL